jgi:hypothetical protein
LTFDLVNLPLSLNTFHPTPPQKKKSWLFTKKGTIVNFTSVHIFKDDFRFCRAEGGDAARSAMSYLGGGEENSLFAGRRDFNTSTPKRLHSLKSPIDATTQL